MTNKNKDLLKNMHLNELEKEIIDAHPILAYRIKNITNGLDVRGLSETDSKKCAIVLDDSIIGGQYHFPCVIYMREKGEPIGVVGTNMRKERFEWFKTHDTHKDPICSVMCLDVCREINNKIRDKNKNLKEFYVD